MTRHHYDFFLLLRPTAPLAHGSHNEGNTQILLRREVNVWDARRRRYRRLRIPAVSGSALKAQLRLQATAYLLERAGVPDGSMSHEALRLILKGGKVASGGAATDLERMAQLRPLLPVVPSSPLLFEAPATGSGLRVSRSPRRTMHRPASHQRGTEAP